MDDVSATDRAMKDAFVIDEETVRDHVDQRHITGRVQLCDPRLVGRGDSHSDIRVARRWF